MKKLYLFFVFLLTFVVFVKAQDEKATIYLLRSDGPDRYVPYYTYLDETLLCKLGRGKYSVHTVNAGEHKLHTQYKGKVKSTPESDLVVKLEPGKTYYFAVNIETKAFGKGRMYCEQLSEEDGKKRAQVFTLDKQCL